MLIMNMHNYNELTDITKPFPIYGCFPYLSIIFFNEHGYNEYTVITNTLSQKNLPYNEFFST